MLLCRCLYLAFISYEIGTKKITSVADVPRRSCVVYVGKEATPQRYLLSVDYPTAPSNSGDKETERRAQVIALDAWHRSTILNPAIKHVPLVVGESLPTIPPLAPWYRQQLADLLYRDLYQNPVLAKASLVTWTGLLTAFNAQYLAGPPQQTVPPLPLPLARLKGHERVGAQLGQRLLEIVDLRLNPKLDPTALDKSFIAFFKCFLTPHTCLPVDLSFKTEIVEPKSLGLFVILQSRLFGPQVGAMWSKCLILCMPYIKDRRYRKFGHLVAVLRYIALHLYCKFVFFYVSLSHNR